MKTKVVQLLLLFCLCLFGCNKSSEFFIGKWQILSVVENDESIRLIDNWIHLKVDGTFTSYDGELEKKENGNWHYENKTGELIIDGNEDSEDSRWYLQTKNDTLIFKSNNKTTYLYAVKIIE